MCSNRSHAVAAATAGGGGERGRGRVETSQHTTVRPRNQIPRSKTREEKQKNLKKIKENQQYVLVAESVQTDCCVATVDPLTRCTGNAVGYVLIRESQRALQFVETACSVVLLVLVLI